MEGLCADVYISVSVYRFANYKAVEDFVSRSVCWLADWLAGEITSVILKHLI